jgi:DNA polymerase I-like protein with 3'-5' exonuclease and polymerase domains/uracil-DNA glycosylase
MSDTLIHGVGPRPCETMVISEKPGFRKDLRELDHYFNGMDLPDRSDVFVTSLLRQPGGKDYSYTSADYAVSEPYLQTELQEVLPKIIITLGREATRYFLGDVDMESCEGIPFWMPDTCDKYPCPPERVTIFPVVHPAIGAHNSEMSPHVVAGFHQLAEYYEGNVQPRLLFDDPYKEPQYEEITNARSLDQSLAGCNAETALSIDTEGWTRCPWSVQYSYEPGTGYLISANDRNLLRRFSRHLRRIRPVLVFHSALHDLGMLRVLDIDISGLKYDDTMVMAYLLQLVPKGLKAGCLRYCSMKMDEYTDIIGDTANILARDYLTWLFDIEQADYEDKQYAELIRLQTTPYTNAKGKVLPGRKIRKVPTLPKSPLHKAAGRVLQSKRPHSLWLDQLEDIQVAGYHRLGPLPHATLDYVERPVAVNYGCRDADGTTRLAPEYRQQINSMGLSGTYDLELATYPFIDRMQQVGLLPDLEHFATLSEVLQSEIDRLRQELDEATGLVGFNANSGDQVAAYLFDKLNLEPLKMTESGRGSTNDKILEALEHEHPEYPVISTVREYRETYKLKNTFVDRLPDFVNRYPFDGRIHATFRTTSVVTGRLAASEPNVLAQPEHGKFAPYFKRGWVAGSHTTTDGRRHTAASRLSGAGILPHRTIPHVICQWDESQVELRGLAHLSQDPIMLAVFRGEKRNPDGSMIDLHAALAERIFGVKPALQDKHRHRLPAKAINFGIPMGMTCKGLSVELRKNGVDADEDTAQRWLDETLALYEGVAAYMEERKAEARRHGFIRCLSGRIRYIGGIRSHNARVREEAERFAFSTPIQESATYIMKQAEKIVYEDILVPYWKDGRWIEPLLQVHDCIKIECEEGMEQELHELMTCAMTQVPQGFSVPLLIEGEWGWNMAPMVQKDIADWYNPEGMRGF